MRVLVLALLGVACGPGPEVDCGEDLPRLILTPSQDPSSDLSDGDETVLVHGPQGGWHVEVGMRATSASPRVSLDLVVTSLGAVVVDNHYDLRLYEHDGCTGVREGLFGFLDVSALAEGDADTPPELLVGEDLVVTGTLTADEGVVVDEVRLVGVPDPKDVED